MGGPLVRARADGGSLVAAAGGWHRRRSPAERPRAPHPRGHALPSREAARPPAERPRAPQPKPRGHALPSREATRSPGERPRAPQARGHALPSCAGGPKTVPRAAPCLTCWQGVRYTAWGVGPPQGPRGAPEAAHMGTGCSGIKLFLFFYPASRKRLEKKPFREIDSTVLRGNVLHSVSKERLQKQFENANNFAK